MPLAAIADIQLDQGPTSIRRYDRDRQAAVAADLVGNSALGDAMAKIFELPVMKSLPKGVTVRQAGDAETLEEMAEGFANVMKAGLLMVYAVLVLLFGSVLQPITILFSLPLRSAARSSRCSSPATAHHSGLDRHPDADGHRDQERHHAGRFRDRVDHAGMPRDEAIVDAGKKRARPIIMTSIAMVAGMVPSALAFGAGGEFRSPMALAVIGGLIFSTILSLLFVPAMFTMMDDVGNFFWRIGRKLIVSSADADGRLRRIMAPQRHRPRQPRRRVSNRRVTLTRPGRPDRLRSRPIRCGLRPRDASC